MTDMTQPNNSTQQHPDEQSLVAYLGGADKAHEDEVSLHLAACASCRDQVSAMIRLRSAAAELHTEIRDEARQQLVNDFVYGGASSVETEALKQAIKADDGLLKSALYSLSSKVEYSQNATSGIERREGRRLHWPAWLRQWPGFPVQTWTLVGATALITLMLTVVVQALIPSPERGIAIASYRDDSRIRFAAGDSLPGIGFFSGAQQQSEKFDGMLIDLRQKQWLSFEWPTVRSALDYRLDLYRFSAGERIQLDGIDTRRTQVRIRLPRVQINQRYEWTLSGHTTDNKTFQTSGGFVLLGESGTEGR